MIGVLLSLLSYASGAALSVMALSAEPEPSDLARLKAFIAAPPPVERILFENNSVRYEGAWDSGIGFVLTLFAPSGWPSEQGAFNEESWNYAKNLQNKLETLTIYQTYTKELHDTARRSGLYPGEEILQEALACGIFALKHGSLKWDNKRFTALANDRIPIEGYMANFDPRGRPGKIFYGYSPAANDFEIMLGEYDNPTLPSFFPSKIDRHLVDHKKGTTRTVGPIAIHEMVLSQTPLNPDRLNPLVRHTNAIRIYHTNSNYLRFTGTNLVPVFAGNVNEGFSRGKIVLFLGLAIATSAFLLIRGLRQSRFRSTTSGDGENQAETHKQSKEKGNK